MQREEGQFGGQSVGQDVPANLSNRSVGMGVIDVALRAGTTYVDNVTEVKTGGQPLGTRTNPGE